MTQRRCNAAKNTSHPKQDCSCARILLTSYPRHNRVSVTTCCVSNVSMMSTAPPARHRVQFQFSQKKHFHLSLSLCVSLYTHNNTPKAQPCHLPQPSYHLLFTSSYWLNHPSHSHLWKTLVPVLQASCTTVLFITDPMSSH